MKKEWKFKYVFQVNINKGLISKILGPILDNYLEGFDRDQLNLSIAGGKVNVNELKLKSTALQDIHPGLIITHGKLDNVDVSFSLLRLSSVPIEVTVKNMTLLVTSKESIKIDEEKIEQWVNEKLISKLQALFASQELFSEQMKSSDQNAGQSKFVKNLITKIINNVKIKIQRIHIRVELPNENTAIGFTLGNLQIYSVDEQNNEIIVKETDGKLRKRVLIKDLSVYCSSQINKISALSDQRQKMFLIQSVATKDNYQQTNFQYIIKPMTLDLMFIWDRDENRSKDKPQFDVKLNIEDFNINITMLQINTLVTAMACLQFGVNINRPDLLPKENNTEEITTYMIQNVLYDEIMDEAMKESQNYEIKRYMELFAQHYINQQLNEYSSLVNQDNENYTKHKITPKYMFTGDCSCLLQTESEKREMALLQEVLSIEQINKCRQIVIFYLKDHKLKQLKKDQQYWILTDQQIEQVKKDLQDYISKKETKTQEQLDQQFLSAQVQFNSLSLNLDQTEVIEVIRERQADETTKFKNVTIPKLTGIIQEVKPLLSLSLLNIQIGFRMKLNNEIGLELTVDELNTIYKGEAQFRKIIQKVPGNKKKIIECIQNDYDIKDINKQMDVKLNLSSDKKVKVQLNIEPIAIVISSTLIDVVQSILKEIQLYKQYQSEETQELIEAADDELDNFKGFGEAAVKQATENHMTLDINLEIEAPKIIIPYLNFNKEYQYFIINLGDVIINTESIYKQQITEKQELYDYFKVELSNLYIINGGTQQEIQRDLQILEKKQKTDSLLLVPIQLNVNLAMCYVVNYYDVPRMLVDVQLSKIHLQLNKYQINNFIVLALYLKQLLFPLLQKSIEQQDDQDENEQKLKLSDFEKRLLKIVDEDIILSNTSMSQSSTISSYKQQNKSKNEIAQFVLMKCEVCLQGVQISLGYTKTILDIQLNILKVQLLQQPYNTDINVQLKEILIQDYDSNHILQSQQNEYFVDVVMNQYKKQHPDFKNCETKIDVKLNQLIFEIHSQSITNSINEIILLVAETNSSIQQTVIESTLQIQEITSKNAKEKVEHEVQYPYEKLFLGLHQLIQNSKTTEPIITIQNMSIDVQIQPINFIMFNFNDKQILKIIIGEEQVKMIQSKETMQINYQLYDIQILTCIQQNQYQLLKCVNNQQVIDAKVNMNNPKDQSFNGYLIQGQVSNQNQISVQIDTRELFTILNFVKEFIDTCQNKIEYKKVQEIMNQYVQALNTEQKQQLKEQQQKEQQQQKIQKIIPTLLFKVDFKLPIISVPFGGQIQKQIYVDLGKVELSNQYQNLTANDINMQANIQYKDFKVAILNDKNESIYNFIQNVSLGIIAELPIQQKQDNRKLIKVDVLSQQEIEIDIGIQLKLLLIEMLQPDTNLGYRIIDEQQFFKEDVDKLLVELNELKQQDEQNEQKQIIEQKEQQDNQQPEMDIIAKVNFKGIIIKIENPKDKNNEYYARVDDLIVNCDVQLGKDININQCDVSLNKIGFQSKQYDICSINNLNIGAQGSLNQMQANLSLQQIQVYADIEQFIPLLDYIPQPDEQEQKIQQERSEKRKIKQQITTLQQQINQYKQGKINSKSIKINKVDSRQNIQLNVKLQQLLCQIPLVQSQNNQLQIYVDVSLNTKVNLLMKNQKDFDFEKQILKEFQKINNFNIQAQFNINKIGLKYNTSEQHFISNSSISADVDMELKQYLLGSEKQVIVNEQNLSLKPQTKNLNIKIYDSQIYQLIASASQIIQKYGENQKIKALIQKGQESTQKNQEQENQKQIQIKTDKQIKQIPEQLKNELQPGVQIQEDIVIDDIKYLQVQNKNSIQIMLNTEDTIGFQLYIRRNPLISFELQHITVGLNLYQIQQYNQPQLQLNALLTLALKGYIIPYDMEMYIIEPTEIFANIINTNNEKELNQQTIQVQIAKGLDIDVSTSFIKSILKAYTDRISNLIFTARCLISKETNHKIINLRDFDIEQNDDDFQRYIISNNTQNKIILQLQDEQIEVNSYQQIQREKLQDQISINVYNVETEELIGSEKIDINKNCIISIGQQKQILIRNQSLCGNNKITIQPSVQIINECENKINILNNNKQIQILPNETSYIENCVDVSKLILIDEQEQIQIKNQKRNNKYVISIEKFKQIQIIHIKPSFIIINKTMCPVQVNNLYLNQQQQLDSTQINFKQIYVLSYIQDNTKYTQKINLEQVTKSQTLKFINENKKDVRNVELEIQNNDTQFYILYEKQLIINMLETDIECQINTNIKQYNIKQNQIYPNTTLSNTLMLNNTKLQIINSQTIQNEKYRLCLVRQKQLSGSILIQLLEGTIIENKCNDISIVLYDSNNEQISIRECKKGKTLLIENFAYLQVQIQNNVSRKIDINKIQGEVQVKCNDMYITLFICQTMGQRLIQIVRVQETSIYQIINKCSKQIKFQQKGTQQMQVCDTNMISQIDIDKQLSQYLVIQYKQQNIEVNTAKLGRRKPQKVDNINIYINIQYQNGIVQIIIDDSIPQQYKDNRQQLVSIENCNSQIHANIDHINLSIFNNTEDISQLNEVIRISIENITADILQSKSMMQIQAQINQLSIIDPNINTINHYILTGINQQKKFLNCIIQMDTDNSQIQYIAAFIENPIQLNIQQSNLDNILSLVQNLFQLPQDSIKYVDNQEYEIDNNCLLFKYNIQHLNYNHIVINNIFISGIQICCIVKIAGVSGISSSITYLTQAVSWIATLNNVQIQLDPISYQGFHGAEFTQLIDEIKHTYIPDIAKQAPQILGGLSIIGQISSSASLFLQGIQETKDSPLEGLQGIQDSYLSVFSNILQSVTQITSSLTFDEQYIKERNISYEESQISSKNAAKNAAKSVGQGLYQGFTDIVTQPIQLGKQEGASGVAKGLGKGLASIVTKPVSGIIDGIGHLFIAGQSKNKKQKVQQKIIIMIQ